MDDEFPNLMPEQPKDDSKNQLYCSLCGTLVEYQAKQIIENGKEKWLLYKQCPKQSQDQQNQHTIKLISDSIHEISSHIINPDSIDDVTNDAFTEEEITSLINNQMYEREYIDCKTCKRKTIQIRYQRKTSTMKFFSICVECRRGVDLATIFGAAK